MKAADASTECPATETRREASGSLLIVANRMQLAVPVPEAKGEEKKALLEGPGTPRAKTISNGPGYVPDPSAGWGLVGGWIECGAGAAGGDL